MNGDIKIHLPIYQLLARKAEIKSSQTKEHQEGAQIELLEVLGVPRSQGESLAERAEEENDVKMWQQQGQEPCRGGKS